MATVTLSVAISDRQSAFGDSVELSATADGIQGVNDHDTQHLENRTALPVSPAELVTKAVQRIDLGPSLKQLGQRMFVARAASSFTAKRPVVQTLGNLLYARDLSGNAANLQLYATTFKSLDSVTLDTLDLLEVDASAFPKATPPTLTQTKPLTVSSSAAGTAPKWPQMLQQATAAVVMVKAGEKAVTERSNAATEERLKSGHAVGGVSIV